VKKAKGLALFFLLSLTTFPFLVFSSQEISVQFSPLQEIINNAKEGSTIYVEQGTYYGITKVNKSLTLIGENVILDADDSQVGIIVSAFNVTLKGFTILNTVRFGNGSIPEEISELWLSPEMEGTGIYVYRAGGVIISDVMVMDCYAGIGLTRVPSPYTKVINTLIYNTTWGIMLSNADHTYIFNSTVRNSSGIWLGQYSSINLAYTTVLSNLWGIVISPNSPGNEIHNNNFINNTYQVYIHPDAQRKVADWTGNFWSDYKGIDLNLDGIGDTPYVIDSNNQDPCPLMVDPQLSLDFKGGGGWLFRFARAELF